MVDWGDPINKDLRGYWPMSELGGLKLFDAVAAQHLTLQNFTTRTVGAVSLGRSVKFNGSNQYALGTLGKIINPPFTQCIWVHLPAYTGFNSSISFGNAGGTNLSTDLSIYASALSVLWGGNNDDATYATGFDTSNRTVFLAGTWDASGLQSAYINGRLIGTRSALGTPSWSSSISIGRRGDNSGFWPGSLANARVFARALRAAEFRRLYEHPFAGIVAPRRRIISQVVAGGATTAIMGSMVGGSRATGPIGATAALSGQAGFSSRLAAPVGASAALRGRAASVSRAADLLTATAAVSARAGSASRAAPALGATAALAARAGASSRGSGPMAAAAAIAARAGAWSRAAGALSTGTLVALVGRMVGFSRVAGISVATAAVSARAGFSSRLAAPVGASAALRGRAASVSRAADLLTAAAAASARAGSASRAAGMAGATAALAGWMTGRSRAGLVPVNVAFPHLWVPRPLWIS